MAARLKRARRATTKSPVGWLRWRKRANMARGSMKKTIGSEFLVAVSLLVGCHQAHAQSWVDAVSQCAPGAKLDDCLGALKQSGVIPAVSKNAGHRYATITLSA